MARRAHPVDAGRALSETALAAATPTLLARSADWAALRLPKATVASAHHAPWSAYWSARLDATLPAAAARAVYEAAAVALEATQQLPGAVLARAAAIETFHLDEIALDALDAQIDALTARLPAAGDWPGDAIEAQVLACGVAILLRAPRHPLLPDWAARGMALLRRLPPGAVRVRLATFVLQHHLWRGELALAALVAEAVPGLDTRGLMPAEAIAWHQSLAALARFQGDFAAGVAQVQTALALAARHGLHEQGYALHAHGAALALGLHDAAAASRHVAAMQAGLAERPQEDQTHYWHFRAGLALVQGEPASAVAFARTALANSLQIGGPYRTVAHRLSLGQALLVSGDAAGAASELDHCAAEADAIDAQLAAFSARLMRSEALHRQGRGEGAEALLRQALAVAAVQGFVTTGGWWLPEVVARLLARALAAGIETEHATRWIRRAGLRCPVPHAAAWPWPLRIRAFGSLRIERDGQPLNAHHGPGAKAAQRPLELLGAVLSHAPAPLPVASAMAWLWPDGSTADPRKAFDVTLLRLRRLLGSEPVLRLDGARLAFDDQQVHVDVAEADALLGRITQAHAPGAAEPPAGQRSAWARELAALLGGPLLDGATQPWVRAARERQRRRIAAAVAALAGGLALNRAAHEALHLVQRAFDADPADEALARLLIAQLVQGGEPGQAQRVLHLCSAMRVLADDLPLAPETLALARRLGLLAP